MEMDYLKFGSAGFHWSSAYLISKIAFVMDDCLLIRQSNETQKKIVCCQALIKLFFVVNIYPFECNTRDVTVADFKLMWSNISWQAGSKRVYIMRAVDEDDEENLPLKYLQQRQGRLISIYQN